MFLALILFAAACPAGQTQVYGTGTGAGTISIYPKDHGDPIVVKTAKGQKWTACVEPTLPWVHSINDDHFTPWWDEVHAVIDGQTRHMKWQIPPQATVDSKLLETDGVVH